MQPPEQAVLGVAVRVAPHLLVSELVSVLLVDVQAGERVQVGAGVTHRLLVQTLLPVQWVFSVHCTHTPLLQREVEPEQV